MIAEHDRVVDRRLAALDRYRLAAEQRLAAFAQRIGTEAPELGAERPYASWRRWWKASRDALPATFAAASAADDDAPVR